MKTHGFAHVDDSECLSATENCLDQVYQVYLLRNTRQRNVYWQHLHKIIPNYVNQPMWYNYENNGWFKGSPILGTPHMYILCMYILYVFLDWFIASQLLCRSATSWQPLLYTHQTYLATGFIWANMTWRAETITVHWIWVLFTHKKGSVAFHIFPPWAAMKLGQDETPELGLGIVVREEQVVEARVNLAFVSVDPPNSLSQRAYRCPIRPIPNTDTDFRDFRDFSHWGLWIVNISAH